MLPTTNNTENTPPLFSFLFVTQNMNGCPPRPSLLVYLLLVVAWAISFFVCFATSKGPCVVALAGANFDPSQYTALAGANFDPSQYTALAAGLR